MTPDVIVARRAQVTHKDLPAAPVIAVEVLSPSTRWIDLGRKKQILADAGCPCYWTIEPGDQHTPPTLTSWQLVDGDYVEVARVSGDESWHMTRPFELTLVPNQLLDD